MEADKEFKLPLPLKNLTDEEWEALLDKAKEEDAEAQRQLYDDFKEIINPGPEVFNMRFY